MMAAGGMKMLTNIHRPKNHHATATEVRPQSERLGRVLPAPPALRGETTAAAGRRWGLRLRVGVTVTGTVI